jgi:DNA-binding NtrC family response regulator
VTPVGRRGSLPSEDQPANIAEMDNGRTVLIVSKYCQYIGRTLQDIFVSAGYECLRAGYVHEGLKLFRESHPALIVSDLRMPFMRMNGLDLLRQVRQEDPDAAVIMPTGNMESGTVKACLMLGAFKVLSKPVNVDELLIVAERALERRQLLIERRERLQICGFGSA